MKRNLVRLGTLTSVLTLVAACKVLAPTIDLAGCVADDVVKLDPTMGNDPTAEILQVALDCKTDEVSVVAAIMSSTTQSVIQTQVYAHVKQMTATLNKDGGK
jgi:hypothetical protein